MKINRTTIVKGLVLAAVCVVLFWIIRIGDPKLVRDSDPVKEPDGITEECSETDGHGKEESKPDSEIPAATPSEADGLEEEEEQKQIPYRPLEQDRDQIEEEPPEVIKGPPKVIIASDLHILARELTDGGVAFRKRAELDDGKTTLYSEEIVEAFLDEVLAVQPDALVLSGDLTFEGERLSHVRLAEMLKRVRDAGIQVLVIPGNHDINNLEASSYFDTIDNVEEGTGGYRAEKLAEPELPERAGTPKSAEGAGTPGNAEGGGKPDSAESTGTPDREPDGYISPEEFEEIYQAYGYEQAISRDEHSLSYVYPLREDVWMMMLDTNQYDPVNLVDGEIKPETYQWMIGELGKADEAGIMVVPVGHHNILSVSRFYTSEVMIWSRSSAIWLFGEHKLPLYLSGHLHVQRMKKYKSEPGVLDEAYGVHEIVTSSLGMAPHQYGVLTWDEEYQLEYQARRVDVERWAERTGSQDENLLKFNQYSRDWYYQVVKGKVLKNLSYFPEDIMQDMAYVYADVLYHYGAGEMMDRKQVESSRGYRMWERFLPDDRKMRDINMMLKDLE